MTDPERPAALLVIGIGAEDRGDDAAGILVARELRRVAPAGVDVRECVGDAGSLLALLEGARGVVVVDAARGGVPGSVEVVTYAALRARPARSTHGLGLVDALAIAGALRTLPPVVRIYAIHGARFELGPLSPSMLTGICRAVELIRRGEFEALH
jgi:hydrogenase maturation protease